LICGKNEAKLKPVDGKIQLRLLVDKVSIEIFANNGRVYMPMRALPTGTAKGLQVFTKGGKTKLNSLKVREVKSIWDY
jgi:fructan beta-fructosidase